MSVDPPAPDSPRASLPAAGSGSDLDIVFDAMAAAVTRCSRDLRYVWVSRAYADWLGRRPEEIAGQPIVTILGEQGLATIRPYVARVLAGERVEYEDRLSVHSIGVRTIHAVYVPTYGDDPQPTGWVALVRDITAERERAQQLSHSELRARWLAAIVDSSDDAILSKDLDGTITSWNRGAERMFGFTTAEAIGRSIRIIIPDDREDEEDAVLETIRRGESIERFETVRRRKDGSRIAISLTVSPVKDASGAIVGASKIARDVSPERRAATRTAFLAETGKVLASSLDYETTLKAVVNLAVPAIADWCAVDILREGTLEQLAVAHVDPAKIPLAATIRRRFEGVPQSPPSVVRSGMSVLVPSITDEVGTRSSPNDQERLRLVRQLGLRSYICVPLIAHGQTLGALTLITAESQRVYSEDDLSFAQEVALRAALAVDNARAYDHVQRANRLKDEFLATLSHELRTPLNAIVGYARMIRSGSIAGDKGAKAIATLERNATSLSQIVEDVLDVSRIVAGKLRLDVQPVVLPDIVERAVETILPAANAKGVRVNMVVDPRAGPISGDPERLQQVVWNLVSNAVKFTPRGGQVQIRVERVNSHVELVVSDTGIGIREEFLPHIFERFRQADAGSTRAHGGLGLGLAITRHLIELHGGTIQASSAGEATGATFRVTLPVMIVHAISTEERRVHPRGPSSDTTLTMPNLNGIHVMAVDDDEDALTLVRDILEMTGARVTTVDSARAALAALEHTAADVLIADIGMSGMDGYELIAQMRKSPVASMRALPAAALTAYARSEDRAKALRLGFQMHLAKPIDPNELMAAVAALAHRNMPE